jgi:hypothetical protein
MGVEQPLGRAQDALARRQRFGLDHNDGCLRGPARMLTDRPVYVQ